MPLNIRSIAVSFAVMCFFAVAFAAWISGLTPFTCSKRALTGALLGYIAAALAAKTINAILISAMVENKMRQQKGKNGGGEN